MCISVSGGLASSNMAREPDHIYILATSMVAIVLERGRVVKSEIFLEKLLEMLSRDFGGPVLALQCKNGSDASFSNTAKYFFTSRCSQCMHQQLFLIMRQFLILRRHVER